MFVLQVTDKKTTMKGWKKRNSGDPPTPAPGQQLPSSAESDGRGEEECAHVDRTPTSHESDEQLLQRKNFIRRAPVADGTAASAAAADDEDGVYEEDMEDGEKGDGDEYWNSLQAENGEAVAAADAGDGEDTGELERPTLAEGFFEIESVRRKRVRKGQVQYLIKWRGWPETENTWEPVENLMSVYDVIDAFEESLRSGKRKRKRKHGSCTQSQIRKKQHLCSPSSATFNTPDVKVRVSAEPLSFTSNEDVGVSNHAGGVTHVANENVMNGDLVSPRINAREDLNYLDTKLKGAIDNDEENHSGKFAVHSQEAQVSGQVAGENGSANSDYTETFQSGRCTGARRRKSGSVKRFKQETTSCKTDDPENVAFSSVASGIGGNQAAQNCDFVGNEFGYKNKTDSPNDFCNITEIIRPLSYSSSMTNSMQDITVTFMAKRSDGKEVTVDNKFLKSNHPLLLINFYEQNLQYTPA